jgi:hypothetical protein
MICIPKAGLVETIAELVDPGSIEIMAGQLGGIKSSCLMMILAFFILTFCFF